MQTKTIQKSSYRPINLLGDAALLSVGGTAYYAMEILFRGYSHWSMAVCGGVCLDIIYHINHKLKHRPIFLRAALGASVISAVELLCGCIVNLGMGLRVWDYSKMPLNLLGQICLPFSLIWLALCFPVCGICSFVDGKA